MSIFSSRLGIPTAMDEFMDQSELTLSRCNFRFTNYLNLNTCNVDETRSENDNTVSGENYAMDYSLEVNPEWKMEITLHIASDFIVISVIDTLRSTNERQCVDSIISINRRWKIEPVYDRQPIFGKMIPLGPAFRTFLHLVEHQRGINMIEVERSAFAHADGHRNDFTKFRTMSRHIGKLVFFQRKCDQELKQMRKNIILDISYLKMYKLLCTNMLLKWAKNRYLVWILLQNDLQIEGQFPIFGTELKGISRMMRFIHLSNNIAEKALERVFNFAIPNDVIRIIMDHLSHKDIMSLNRLYFLSYN